MVGLWVAGLAIRQCHELWFDYGHLFSLELAYPAGNHRALLASSQSLAAGALLVVGVAGIVRARQQRSL